MDSEEKVCMDFEQQILEPYSQSLCTPIWQVVYAL
jgi:hypothetical protein